MLVGNNSVICMICKDTVDKLQCPINQPVATKTVTGGREFTCDICSKVFSTKSNLLHHKRYHPTNSGILFLFIISKTVFILSKYFVNVLKLFQKVYIK